ncbi:MULTISPECIES: endolytic transglycosylase MltG [Streptomyces]|uniref:Endolytic murein transglycosylase n=2 Tax=Streptomyces rochei group TaxID=2867164 RepID=A0AAX3ZDP8_STRRO|nr:MULTISPECIES: endolytic transglycosylase MltG [Streptomyces]WDI17395.1 endolytic transglycosylase MltG [Streptomyces enissocaesilis]MBQ0879167.1 endolytic transglycosylase MltG [Streptomyces sp. RT42]MBQ0913636.1 endolytic transglycosylase MltG [Streptomyces sp. RM99]MBU8548650.1 endolytic transglycosylase MltG [Streptomyces sp. Osf17]MBU8555425.1 endolytic transglycosylase MltG [Streptomyces sp. Babs14]
MTEYGRGQGSEPWHPEDPLYGDGGWGGQQTHTGQQPPYGGQPQQYPEQPQSPQQYGDWGNGGQPAYGQQPQYDQYGQQHPEPQYDQYGRPQYDQQGYDNGGWDSGAHPQAQYPADPTDPYGQQAPAYGGEQPDYYGTPQAYPPPEPPTRRRAEPEPQHTDWDPGPDEGEHAFFAGGDAEEDEEPADGGRGERRARGGGKPKKRRNGCACLVVCLVLGGGVAGVGYFGYQFYQERFGAAPDYAGDGNGEQVTVTIPKGAGGSTIGQELKRQGVVKSVDAFIAAQQSNPQGKSIQDGVYTLQKEMSAESAVELLLNPKSRSNLIVAEGRRNVDVYKLIDKQLGVDEGTTAKVAESEWKSLGLPEWAMNHKNVKDPLEGFLYPSSYSAAKGQKPEDVLKQMVARANEQYEKIGLEQKAEGLGLDGPWQLLTVASLVQAEGKTHEDFRKMSEVIYNRLKPTNTETNQELQFDSTFNYLKGQSEIRISESEINSNPDPYNTYTNKGLPPGPIGNPGEEALQAALSPTSDGWMYFVATDGVSKTEFAKTHDEFLKLKDKFDAVSGN